jgi:hypothetical protein
MISGAGPVGEAHLGAQLDGVGVVDDGARLRRYERAAGTGQCREHLERADDVERGEAGIEGKRDLHGVASRRKCSTPGRLTK